MTDIFFVNKLKCVCPWRIKTSFLPLHLFRVTSSLKMSLCGGVLKRIWVYLSQFLILGIFILIRLHESYNFHEYLIGPEVKIVASNLIIYTKNYKVHSKKLIHLYWNQYEKSLHKMWQKWEKNWQNLRLWVQL